MTRASALALACLLASCGPKQAAIEPAVPEAVEQAPAPAEPRPDERITVPEAVQKSVEELFASCEAGDLEKAAGHVVYRGDDPARRWKTVCTLETEEETEAVKQVCGAVTSLLASSDSHTMGAYETETESEGTWHVQEVIFEGGAGTERVIFAFLEIGGVYALGDID